MKVWLNPLAIPIIRHILTAALILILANLILPLLPLPLKYTFIVNKILVILLIVTLTWLAIKIVSAFENSIIKRYQEQSGENVKARIAYTKMHILRQIAVYFILSLALAAFLMTFEGVKELGISIITSIGFLTAILGLAAQRSLGTLFSGLQIALTQPIRIGDAVIIENEFGNIEEITLTYVSIRLWDLRRLIVPITYFLDKPIQNWTRESQALLGTVMLYMDFTISVDKIREKFNAIIKQSQYWDGKLGLLHVTEFKEKTIELRFTMSAMDANQIWNLRCEVREKLLAYITQQFPDSLPKLRWQQLSTEASDGNNNIHSIP